MDISHSVPTHHYKRKVRSVFKAVTRTRLSQKGGGSRDTSQGESDAPDGMLLMINTWNQILAEVMVTEIQMGEMSFGKESMTSFSNVFNER